MLSPSWHAGRTAETVTTTAKQTKVSAIRCMRETLSSLESRKENTNASDHAETWRRPKISRRGPVLVLPTKRDSSKIARKLSEAGKIQAICDWPLPDNAGAYSKG
jgi:hypothetical protein